MVRIWGHTDLIVFVPMTQIADALVSAVGSIGINHQPSSVSLNPPPSLGLDEIKVPTLQNTINCGSEQMGKSGKKRKKSQ